MILLELFWRFFLIGAFTFGGGYAMIPLIQNAVTEQGWMSLEELIDFIAVSESTPGPFAVNIATYVGRITAGIPGSVCATLGVVLPSLIVMLVVAGMYDRFRRSRVVKGAMAGLRPAVIGLIGAALISLGRNVFFPDGFAVTPVFLFSIPVFLLSAVLAFKKISPIALIGLSAGLGIAAGYCFGL